MDMRDPTESVDLAASVVIPVRNDGRVRRCILSVLDQRLEGGRGYEVIVVDNDSDRLNIAQLLSDLPVRLLTEKRRGIAAAANRGLAEAKGDFLVRIDADCVAMPNWLGELLDPFCDHAVGAVGGAVHKEAGGSLFQVAARNIVDEEQTRPQHLPMVPAPYVVTANAAFPRTVVQGLGGFDERLMSGSDVDMSCRIALAGYQIRTAPKARVYHPVRPTIPSYFRQYYQYGKGHALLFKKYRGVMQRRALVNAYPFKGIGRVVARDIPRLCLGTIRAKRLDPVAIMSIVAAATEYSALICGDIAGAIEGRSLYV